MTDTINCDIFIVSNQHLLHIIKCRNKTNGGYTMNELQVLNYEGANVEVVVLDGVVLFNAKQVGAVLELTNVRASIVDFDEDEKVKVTNSMLNSGVNNVYTRKLNNMGETFLTEAGVYKLVFISRKPEAKTFQKWVTKEVLPSIRQTGSYGVSKRAMLLEDIYCGGQQAILSAKQLTELEIAEATAPLVETIETQKPLVTFAECALTSEDDVLIRELAKIASKKVGHIGQKKLYEKLREWGFIFKNSPEAKQVGIDRGFFVLEERVITTPHSTKLKFTTKVTPKGQVYIIERLLKELED